MPYTPGNFCKTEDHDLDFYQWTFFGYEKECVKCGQLMLHFAIPEMWEQIAAESGMFDTGEFLIS